MELIADLPTWAIVVGCIVLLILSPKIIGAFMLLSTFIIFIIGAVVAGATYLGYVIYNKINSLFRSKDNE